MKNEFLIITTRGGGDRAEESTVWCVFHDIYRTQEKHLDTVRLGTMLE